MIKSSVTPMMLSYTDDVEQRTGLAAGIKPEDFTVPS